MKHQLTDALLPFIRTPSENFIISFFQFSSHLIICAISFKSYIQNSYIYSIRNCKFLIMSNRFVSRNKNDHRSFAKPQKHFIPKNPNNPPQTLSNSLRATSSAATNNSDAVAASSSRVRKGEDGEWVKKASTSGNFVIYLPQDEAVAAGLGPDEGGLDPVESQRVVDLLNRELSRLLKLNPRDFWKEGWCSWNFVDKFGVIMCF